MLHIRPCWTQHGILSDDTDMLTYADDAGISTATKLFVVEYENGRTCELVLLNKAEADPACDTVRLMADGEPLLDMTPSEFADITCLFAQAFGKYFKALIAGSAAFNIALRVIQDSSS